jgi:hypothetical protein
MKWHELGESKSHRRLRKVKEGWRTLKKEEEASRRSKKCEEDGWTNLIQS